MLCACCWRIIVICSLADIITPYLHSFSMLSPLFLHLSPEEMPKLCRNLPLTVRKVRWRYCLCVNANDDGCGVVYLAAGGAFCIEMVQRCVCYCICKKKRPRIRASLLQRRLSTMSDSGDGVFVVALVDEHLLFVRVDVAFARLADDVE